MKQTTQEIIDDLEYMKKYGEFFAYQNLSIDSAIERLKQYDELLEIKAMYENLCKQDVVFPKVPEMKMVHKNSVLSA